MKTLAIIGGGISGLAIAEAVHRHGQSAGLQVRTVVLEAERDIGGKIRTSEEGGFVLETGPHGFLDKEPAAMALVERLGLDDQLVRADEASDARFVLRDGKLRRLPMKPPQFLRSDILPLSGKLRVMMEPLIAQSPADEQESVRAFASRRIGPQAADVLVDAMVTGIYGGDPARLSVSAAFPRLVEIEQTYGGLIKGQLAIAKKKKKSGGTQQGFGGPSGALHSFKRGLFVLIEALGQKTDVLCEYRAESISRTKNGKFRIDGTGTPIEADAVCVTTPAYASAQLLAPFAEEDARVLATIPYAAVSVVVQCFKKDEVGHPLDGFGFLVPNRESRQILGSIWASTVFHDHAPEGTVMLRTLVGGARHPDLADGDDETLFERARKELVEIMGIRSDARPILQKAIRWPKAIPQYEIGHETRVAAADRIEERVPGIFLSGNALRGVAMIQCVKDAENVAPKIVAELGKA